MYNNGVRADKKLFKWVVQLTPPDSTNVVQNIFVDRLIFVDNVDGEDDADAERRELFSDRNRRRLAEAVYMRRRNYDRSRPLHNH